MECRAIIVGRNEVHRLPWLLQYYRKLGIARFFVVDNDSEDNSLEFLRQQKDCHVFSTKESFAAAGFGTVWQRWILSQYGESHWWLIADTDEMLVYPDSETASLPAFCRYLDSVGAQAVYAILLDLYSKVPVSQAVYRPGQSFLEVCSYFDADYKFRPRLRKPWQPVPFPPLEPIGGPRLRRFYPEYKNATKFDLVKRKLLRTARDLLRKVGINLNIPLPVPPILFKVPLLKWKKGIELVNSHRISPVPLAPVTCALLHFKFFSDFHERVTKEAQRGEHFDGASEYSRYMDVMKSQPDVSFHYSGSVHYENSRQLAALGLIKDDESYARYRAAGQGHETPNRILTGGI